jgi:hypothetical protein
MRRRKVVVGAVRSLYPEHIALIADNSMAAARKAPAREAMEPV